MVIFIFWIAIAKLKQKPNLKKVCESKDFCDVVIPLKFNKYQKFDKTPSICADYPDIDDCKKSSTANAGNIFFGGVHCLRYGY